jgi:hypothetical protein
MLAYEVLHSFSNSPSKPNLWSKAQNTIIVYNFHSFYSQNRIFLFTQTSNSSTKSKFLKINDASDSIAELFPAAN